MYRLHRIPLVVVLAVLLAACGDKAAGPGGPPGGGMPPTQVETVRLQAAPLSEVFEAVGTLRAAESAVIRPEVDGKVTQIHFSQGQPVSAGALLFSLDSALVQASLNEAEATLANSQRALDRAQELAGKALISRADLDAAMALFAIDQARVASARARMDKTRLRAPFAGVTGLRSISEGDFVSTGQALVDLVVLDPMEVELRLPEVLLSRLAVGQSVEVGADAYREERFSGTVTAIAPTVDVGGRSVLLRARFANADAKLKPGMSVRARIVLSTHADALLLPEQAIWPNGEQKMVYRVNEGVATRVPVTLGLRQPGMVEITSGLSAGDEVVIAGHLKLYDGAKVQAVTESAPEPSAH